MFQGDGIFSPGGSLSNMYGMMLARHNAFPEIKESPHQHDDGDDEGEPSSHFIIW